MATGELEHTHAYPELAGCYVCVRVCCEHVTHLLQRSLFAPDEDGLRPVAVVTSQFTDQMKLVSGVGRVRPR